jgi:hypothetical protein
VSFLLLCSTQHRTEIESILALPKIISVMPAYDHENEWMRQVSTDCIWSDPASEDMEGECSIVVSTDCGH